MALSRHGVSFIHEHFDVMFSVLVKFGELASDHQHFAWKIASDAIQQLIAHLDKYFSGQDNEPEKELVTTTKMIVYLLCQILDALEAKSVTVPGDMAKARKSKKKQTDIGSDTETERNSTLISLYQLIQLPIYKLWTPPVVEQDFVNLVSNLCYKILENPILGHVRMKSTRDSVFQVSY